ncbi:MAG: hypothetical protein ACRC0B_06895 [Legionella sp.]
MRILVTGATGFIALQIITQLLAVGFNETLALGEVDPKASTVRVY